MISKTNVTSVTDPRGNTSSAQYDNLRRCTQTTAASPFSFVTKFTYNENGSRTKVERQTSDPGNPWQTSTAAYFIDDLLSSVTSPSNETSTFSYTNLRQPWKTTDPASRVIERTYDAVGRPYTVKDPALDIASTMLYTDNGLLASVKDANNNTTSFDFDGFDRPNKTTYPNASYEQNSSYDANGNVLIFRMRSGNTVTNTFDVLNRLSTKSPTGMPTVTNTFDLAGRLTKISTPTVSGDPTSGDFEFFFDGAGRFYKEKYPDTKEVIHQLDSNGNATKMTYPDGYYIDRVFDELNRLTDIKLNGSGTPSLHFDFDTQSRRTKLTYGNGVTYCQYGFERDDDLTALIQIFNGSAVTFTHKFNNVGELTSSSASDSQFIWHPSGGGTASYGTANNINQYPTVGGVSQSYNTNGCLTGDGTWTFGYDTLNHLISATKSGVSASYLYDPAHRQGQKNVGGTKTRYIYSGFQRIAEYDGTSGSLQKRFVYGTGLDEALIQITSGGTISYFHHDRMGNIVAISDNTGVVTNRYKYAPYGETGSLSGTTHGFQGQRYDSETDLYYMKARYYNPRDGRFLQPDPIGYFSGLNLYRFAANNPNNYSDPQGLAEIKNGPLVFHDVPFFGEVEVPVYPGLGIGNSILDTLNWEIAHQQIVYSDNTHVGYGANSKLFRTGIELNKYVTVVGGLDDATMKEAELMTTPPVFYGYIFCNCQSYTEDVLANYRILARKKGIPLPEEVMPLGGIPPWAAVPGLLGGGGSSGGGSNGGGSSGGGSSGGSTSGGSNSSATGQVVNYGKAPPLNEGKKATIKSLYGDDDDDPSKNVKAEKYNGAFGTKRM